MRIFVLTFFLMSHIVFAQNLKPVEVIEAKGNVIDMVIYDKQLIVGTDGGSVEVFDIDSSHPISEVKFDKIKDFMGDLMDPKIFSVDYDNVSDSYIAVVQASSGSRELIQIKDGKKETLLDKNRKLYISKAKFIDQNRVLLALLSNELILFDIKKKKDIYRFQINFSHFSDLKLSEDKTLAVNGCESGELSIINIEQGKVIKVLKGVNVDNTYKVDIKNGYALGAGQDRRGSVYDISTGASKRFDATFLIYAGALSPSAKLAAFAFNEENDIAIFGIRSGTKLHMLKGQKSTLNTIVFQNEKVLFSGSDDKYIMKWRLP